MSSESIIRQSNPNQEQLLLVKAGNLTLTSTGAASTLAQQAHNLNFVPIIQAVWKNGTAYLPLPYILFDDSTGLLQYQLFCYADSTNIFFQFHQHGLSLAQDFVFKYFLYREKAQA